MKLLIIANWKMNPLTEREARRLLTSIKKGLKGKKNMEIVICPPLPYLSILNGHLSSLKLGAQNCFWKDKGPYTGEVSPQILKNIGCRYVIIGHSERRQIFKETDEMVNVKIKAGKTFHVLEREIKKGLDKISKKEIEKVIIAYEPIWAIGTKKACEENEVMTVALFIKKLVSRLYNKKVASNIRIIYGGSVDSKNAPDYLRESKMDYLRESKMQGLLVGGASLNSKEFIKIIKSLNNIKTYLR